MSNSNSMPKGVMVVVVVGIIVLVVLLGVLEMYGDVMNEHLRNGLTLLTAVWAFAFVGAGALMVDGSDGKSTGQRLTRLKRFSRSIYNRREE